MVLVLALGKQKLFIYLLFYLEVDLRIQIR